MYVVTLQESLLIWCSLICQASFSWTPSEAALFSFQLWNIPFSFVPSGTFLVVKDDGGNNMALVELTGCTYLVTCILKLSTWYQCYCVMENLRFLFQCAYHLQLVSNLCWFDKRAKSTSVCTFCTIRTLCAWLEISCLYVASLGMGIGKSIIWRARVYGLMDGAVRAGVTRTSIWLYDTSGVFACDLLVGPYHGRVDGSRQLGLSFFFSKKERPVWMATKRR